MVPQFTEVPIFCKKTDQGYFVDTTGDFNQLARPKTKYELPCKSFTNNVTK